MRLYTEKGEFTLPEDFTIEMQTNNPVFSDEGSASATFTLAATKENLEAADRPDRLSRRTNFINDVECILQHGAFQIQGRLIVTSCSREEIGCCFTYSEGDFYVSYKDRRLKSLLNYQKLYTATYSMATLATLTQRAMEDEESSGKFAYFPVKVQLMDGYSICLNELADESDEYGIWFGDIVYKARSYTQGDVTINVPDGYGLTAFPFLHHIIEQIIISTGNYTVVRNDFSREPYNHLVLLHPCADLMCKGNVAYKDVVPDITLADFVSWLQDKFGAYIYINGKEVSIIILDEILGEPAPFDLTQYMDDDLLLEIPDMEHVAIELDTSLAEPPADALQDFNDKYGSFTEVANVPSNVTGVYLHTPTGRIIQVVKSGNTYNQVFLGYNNFPFSGGWIDSKGDSKTTEDQIPGCESISHYKPSPILLNLGNAIHYNTAIEGEGEEQNHPLMVAWAYYDGSHWRGSVTGIESDGSALFPGLNPEGLFGRFWRKYNTFKLNHAPEASVSVHIPADKLTAIDITKPVLVRHHRAIVRGYSFTASNQGIISGQFSLWILPDIEYPHEV
ncbi:MAG: hypothetical protein ACI3Z0_03245 [Candidatus Cryptobacteroides sp.]